MSRTVRRVVADDWALLRATRLAMLMDSPAAYGSSFLREIGFDEDLWRGRTATPAFLALDDGLPLGVATLRRLPGHDPEIVGMWVAGHARGSGVADELVTACLEEAARAGASRVTLHVMDDNPAAQRLYQRHGFVVTGDRGDVPGCGQMARDLTG